MSKQDYRNEAEKRWGNTDAFKESVDKTANYSKSDWEEINQKACSINNRLALLIEKPVSDNEVQQLVQEWQEHITKYYYNCTHEILKGLGSMYATDARFKKNYNDIRPGLAQFISKAIKHYCDNIN